MQRFLKEYSTRQPRKRKLQRVVGLVRCIPVANLTQFAIMVAQRLARSTARTWFSDPATYPIMGIVVTATSVASFAGFRYLTKCPDVVVDKEKRLNFLDRHDTKSGSEFRSHRNAVALAVPGPITEQTEGFKA
ncbi:unnamed protein product [Aphanomyces euteiches]